MLGHRENDVRVNRDREQLETSGHEVTRTSSFQFSQGFLCLVLSLFCTRVLLWLPAPPSSLSPAPPPVKTTAPSAWPAKHLSLAPCVCGQGRQQGKMGSCCESAQMFSLGPHLQLCVPEAVGLTYIWLNGCHHWAIDWNLLVSWSVHCPLWGILKASKGLQFRVLSRVKEKVLCWETVVCVFPWFSIPF